MKSRRQFIWEGSLAATAFLVAKPFEGIANGSSFLNKKIARGSTINILHTANIHNISQALTRSRFAGLGGFTNTAKVISIVKNSTKNTLLLDSGNFHTSTSSQNCSHDLLLQQIKQSGYDAMLLGANEMKDERMNNLKLHNLPILDTDENPFHIVQKGNIRVGIIAASNKDSILGNNTIAHINELAEQLSVTHKCNLIVCLSSLGYKNNSNADDVSLAAASEHIDVILGNEKELFMKKPLVAQNKNKHEVVINHVGNAGVVLGNMEITFDEEGKKKSVRFDNLLVGTTNNRWGSLKG
jgi:5'-nucleotidase